MAFIDFNIRWFCYSFHLYIYMYADWYGEVESLNKKILMVELGGGKIDMASSSTSNCSTLPPKTAPLSYFLYPTPLATYQEVVASPVKFKDTLEKLHAAMGTKFMFVFFSLLMFFLFYDCFLIKDFYLGANIFYAKEFSPFKNPPGRTSMRNSSVEMLPLLLNSCYMAPSQSCDLLQVNGVIECLILLSFLAFVLSLKLPYRIYFNNQ